MKCTAISNNNGKESACYTSPLAQMFATPGRLFSCIVFLLFFCGYAVAQDETNPFTPQAAQFIAEIMARAGSPGFVTLEIVNQSSLRAADISTARKAIETQLRAANVRLVKPERAVAEITVTIAENLKGLLWVAEIKQGLTTQTVMLQSGAASAAMPARMPTLQVRRTSIYSASDYAPMLDFILTDVKLLYVLRSQSVTSYKWDGAQWKQLNEQFIARSTPAPRDVRGRLIWQQSQLSAYLPGVQCTAPFASDGILAGIQCREVDDPWPLDDSFEAFFSSNRNFFSGIIRGANFNSAVKSVEASIPPFFSAAAMGDANTVWAFSGTDGRARLYSSFTQPPHVYSGWGSDIASLHSECGPKWQLLISKPGDRSQPDAVQAMEILGGEPLPVSAMLEIPGSITAMWRNQDGAAVNIITRDPATKRYEASTLTIDCR